MNGSLPPISRFTRAIRSMQAAATFFPVSTEPVNATPSIPSCEEIAPPTSPAPGDDVHGARRHVVEDVGDRERGERRHLGRLADRRVARGKRGGELPGQKKQRVVPWDDAADHAEGVLDDERELRRLDRRDHAPGGVAADLGVVVEGGRAPADLVGVLQHGLSALRRHQRRQLVGAARGASTPPRGACRRARSRGSTPTP